MAQNEGLSVTHVHYSCSREGESLLEFIVPFRSPQSGIPSGVIADGVHQLLYGCDFVLCNAYPFSLAHMLLYEKLPQLFRRRAAIQLDMFSVEVA